MSANKIHVEGMEELNKYFTGVPDKILNEVTTTMKKITADLQKEAVKEAPKLSGALRGSANSEVASSSGMVNGFVGFFVPYATRQHEGLNFVHKQGKAKFLETPYKENQQKYIQFIAEATKKAVEKK